MVVVRREETQPVEFNPLLPVTSFSRDSNDLSLPRDLGPANQAHFCGRADQHVPYAARSKWPEIDQNIWSVKTGNRKPSGQPGPRHLGGRFPTKLDVQIPGPAPPA